MHPTDDLVSFPEDSPRAAAAWRFRHVVLTVLLGVLVLPTGSAARDVVSLGSVSLAAPGEIVQIPIYLRDTSGTALGSDAAAGRKIQSLALHIGVLPPNAVSSMSIVRSGVTVGPQALFETSSQVGNRVYALLSFDEATAPLAFTVDAPFPGDPVAMLELEVAKAANEGLIVLSLLDSGTALGNQAGVIVETVDNDQLRTVGGTVLVSPFGLFLDGFESGNAGAWSAAFP